MNEVMPTQQQRTETPYTKLHRTVWLGSGHLLYVKEQLFSRRLKRFDYRDVQALTLRQTRKYGRCHEILLACTLLSVLLLVWTAGYRPPPLVLVLLAFPAIVTLGLMVIHWRLGPTCACHIRTAVQIEHLDAFTRLRTSRPLFQRLCREIGNAQARGWNEPVSQGDVTAWQAPGVAVEPEKPIIERRVPQHRAYRGWAHALLFMALFLAGIVSALSLVQLDRLVMFLFLLNVALLVGGLVAALVMQHTRETTRELRVMAWLCTAYLLARNGVSGVIAPEGFFLNILFMGNINVWEHEAFVLFIIVSMAIEFLLALFGFYFLSQFRRGKLISHETLETADGPPPPAFETLSEYDEEEQP